MKAIFYNTSKSFVMGLIVFIMGSMAAGSVLANSYYVDPVNGSDSSNGSLSLPWRTLGNSIGKLSAGDTLYLRGGNYFESGVRITISGAPSQHIIIKNYNEEIPIIDGGYQDFRAISNNDWELYDSQRNIYRSTKAYPGAGNNGAIHAFLKIGEITTNLIAYERYGDLASDNQLYTETGSMYLGPGVIWNSIDQRIYIRLVSSDLESQMGYSILSNSDPRQNSIYIVPLGVVVNFENNASYLDIEGVSFRYRNNALRFASGHHINVKNVTVFGGTTYILTEQAAHDLVFDTLIVDGYFPEWLAFKDIKSATRPAHAMEVAAFVLHDSENVEIINSTIRNVMDFLDGGGNNLRIHHNSFFDIRDDVVQLDTQCNNVEMAYNRVIGCSKSFDRNQGANATNLGTKYVHHNIIDIRKRHLHFRQGDPLFQQAGGDGKIQNRAFGTHGTIDMDPWKIYHNTVLIGKSVNAHLSQDGIGFDYDETTAPGVPHEVYNNIFIQTEDHRMGQRSRVHDGSQILDGNLYYRTVSNPTEPFFINWANETSQSSFNSLAAFKASSFFDQTKQYYTPGWEANGIEADPMLDEEYHPAANSPAATGAVDLSSKGWPGISGEQYRGALSPAADTSVPSITIISPTSNTAYVTTQSVVSLSGTASDDRGVTSVNWLNDRGGNGTAIGTSNWSVATITLNAGNNLITVSAYDAAGNVANNTLTVTYGSAPTVITGTSTNVLVDSSTVSAVVNPNGLNTTVYFQYGIIPANYTGKTANQILSGTNRQTISAQSIGLSEATDYYYRAAANNSMGTVNGAEMNFTTTDISAPTGLITINNGASYTNTTAVTLSLSASDNRGVVGYYLSTSNTTPSSSAAGWVAVSAAANYSTSVSYTVTTGNGLKTIYCWYKDVAGNVSIAASGSITLDTLLPAIIITSPTSNSTYTSITNTITISGTAANLISVTWSNDRGGSGTATGTNSWSVNTISLQSGDNVITVTATDRAANIATVKLTVTYDGIPPTGSLIINSGAAYTGSTNVTLNLSADDTVAVAGYYLSDNPAVPGASDAGWNTIPSMSSYTASVSYTLTSGNGQKTIYCWYKDAAGNVSAVSSDSIIFDTSPPMITITGPTSGPTYSAVSTPLRLEGTADNLRSIRWENNLGGSGTVTGRKNWSIDNIMLYSGNNEITVTAIDRAGNTAADTITVTFR